MKKKTASGPPKRQKESGEASFQQRENLQTRPSYGNPTHPFLSRKNQLLYEKLVGKQVLRGRFVDFANLFMPSLLQMFQDAHWEGLVTLQESVYPNLVRVFYANLSAEEVTIAPNRTRIIALHSSVEGIPVTITTQYLSEIFHLNDSGALAYNNHSPIWEIPGMQYTEQLRSIFGHEDVHRKRPESTEFSDTNPVLRIMHHIISTNILPRNGHYSMITHMDLFLMATLKERIPVNIGYVIMGNMIQAATTSCASLPYGMILTKIFTKMFENHDHDILRGQRDVQNFELKGNTVYNSISLTRMGLVFKSGMWVKKPVKGKQNIAAGTSSQPERACEIPMEEEFMGGEHEDIGIDTTHFDPHAASTHVPRSSSHPASSLSYSERLAKLEDDVHGIRYNMSEMGRFLKDMDRRLTTKFDLLPPHSPPYDF